MLGPIPLLVYIFYWGASLYFAQHRPPADCLEISMIGKNVPAVTFRTPHLALPMQVTSGRAI